MVSTNWKKSRSKKAQTNTERVKIMFTFKSKYFGENFDDKFETLLGKGSEKNVPEFLKREF